MKRLTLEDWKNTRYIVHVQTIDNITITQPEGSKDLYIMRDSRPVGIITILSEDKAELESWVFERLK